jgi:uncharacterized protein (DUF433 family)
MWELRAQHDWSDCPLVEVNPRKVSGVPILKGTRMQADSVVENYEGGSPVEEISKNSEFLKIQSASSSHSRTRSRVPHIWQSARQM